MTTSRQMLDALAALRDETGDEYAEGFFIGAIASALEQRGQSDAWMTALDTARQCSADAARRAAR